MVRMIFPFLPEDGKVCPIFRRISDVSAELLGMINAEYKQIYI